MSKEKTQGITLISLVITIILLLILAAVAINLAVDGDGLFAKAKEAATDHNTAVEAEAQEINNLLNMFEAMTKCNHTWENGTCSKCGEVCVHVWANGECSKCGLRCTHTWVDGNCSVCGMQGVSSVTISGANTVEVKSTTTLTASYNIGTPEAGELQWTSSNPEVATVDQNGVVTGVCSTKGTTTIKAKYLKNDSVYGEVELTVNPKLVGDCEECENGTYEAWVCPECETVQYERPEFSDASHFECGDCGEMSPFGSICPGCGSENLEGFVGGTTTFKCGCQREYPSFLPEDAYTTLNCEKCENGQIYDYGE